MSPILRRYEMAPDELLGKLGGKRRRRDASKPELTDILVPAKLPRAGLIAGPLES